MKRRGQRRSTARRRVEYRDADGATGADELAATARAAIDAMRRGVIAYSAVAD